MTRILEDLWEMAKMLSSVSIHEPENQSTLAKIMKLLAATQTQVLSTLTIQIGKECGKNYLTENVLFLKKHNIKNSFLKILYLTSCEL